MKCAARKHGTVNAYDNYDCRCPAAVEARRLYSKRRRTGVIDTTLIDPTESREILRTLFASGYGWTTLQGITGLEKDRLSEIALGKPARRVRQSTAEAIRGAMERLRGLYGPDERAASRGARYGWTPFEASWKPEESDVLSAEVALRTGVKLTDPTERITAARVAADRGWSRERIATALGMSGGRVKELLDNR